MGKVEHAIWKDYLYLKQVYPELYMCSLEVKPRNATGTVILPELRSQPREIRSLLSFPIRVVYRDDFPNHAISVFDAEERIDFTVIPPEHCHTFGKYEGLCTHHPDALKLVRNKENQSLLIVRSAILLYLAYLEYLETGKWPSKFKGLPHGEAGERQVKRDLRRWMK